MTDCMERLITNNSQEMSKVVDNKLNNLRTEMMTTMNTEARFILESNWADAQSW
jgi:hypothetical protein